MNNTTKGIAIAKIPLARNPKPANVQNPHQQYFLNFSVVKKLKKAQYKELVIKTVSTISSIATCESIKKNVLLNNIIELYIPNFSEMIFLPKKYVKNTKNVDNTAIGNLTVKGEKVPNIFIDTATNQKYKGGFSKKGIELNSKMFQSFELAKSLAMIVYLVSSTSIRL